MPSIREYRQRIKKSFNVNDILFLLLRLTTVLGCCFWLLFAPISPETATHYFVYLAIFSFYNFILYTIIFFNVEKIREIYLWSLLFDLLFVFHWVDLTQNFDNSFFLGYYLLVVLHTLYFGFTLGFLAATLAAALYLNNLLPYLENIHWTEPGLRAAFIYLIGLPAGFIHGKLKKDKNKIEKLNAQLSESLDNLQRMQTKLVETEKLSALGRLTSGLAHEIRNPLSALGGFSRRLMKRVKPDSPEKRYAEVIVSEVNRLEAILRDIILFTKTGRDLRRGNINETVRNALASALKLYQGEQHWELKEEYQEHLPNIHQDSEQLHLAVNNLIANAVDSMPDGGTLTISTGTEQRNNITWVTVSISDTGKGISQQHTKFIFEPFFSTKRIGPGTGLGLIIVHEIMEDHRGFIQLHSVEGQGTTFKLYFPYQSEEEDDKIPCWQFLRCGIEMDPSRRCPAYPYFGRICWGIAGTLCENKVTGTFAGKIHDCRHCRFFKHCAQLREHESVKPPDV